MTFDEIADAVTGAKDIAEGVVTKERGRIKQRVGSTPGGRLSQIEGDLTVNNYRVWISNGKKGTCEEGPSIFECIKKAFKTLGVKRPRSLMKEGEPED